MLPNKPNRLNKPSPFEKAYFSKGPNTTLRRYAGIKRKAGFNTLKTRRNSKLAKALKNSENANTANIPFFKGDYTVTKTNLKKGEALIQEIIDMPMFLIAAHACICPQEGKCFNKDLDFAFPLQQDTYILSFIQPGDYCTTNDLHIYENADSIKGFLYLHSESDIKYGNRVGRNRFSMFSGIRRAVGSPPEYAKEILYPNVLFTFNEYITGANKKRNLVEQNANPYGVYDISDPPDSWAGFSFNNTMSIIPQNPKRVDWVLKDIIEEVYRVKKISKAIFVLTGCFDKCNPTMPYADLDLAAKYIHDAHNEYVNLREVLTRDEVETLGYFVPTNTGLSYRFNVLAPGEVLNMKKRGVTDPKVYKGMKNMFNETDYNEMENIMGIKFTGSKK